MISIMDRCDSGRYIAIAFCLLSPFGLEIGIYLYACEMMKKEGSGFGKLGSLEDNDLWHLCLLFDRSIN